MLGCVILYYVIMLCMYVCICALCWWELKAMKSDKIDEHWCKLEGDLTLESSSFHPDQTIQKEPAAAVPCLQWCSVPATVGDDAPEIWLLPWAKSWQIPRRTCPVQIQVRSTWTMRCLLYVPQSSSQGGKCQIYSNISKLFKIHQRLNPCKVYIYIYICVCVFLSSKQSATLLQPFHNQNSGWICSTVFSSPGHMTHWLALHRRRDSPFQLRRDIHLKWTH